MIESADQSRTNAQRHMSNTGGRADKQAGKQTGKLTATGTV